MEKFAGRVALVTGSTSGIGFAIGMNLIKKGATVIFHSNKSVEKGLDLKEAHENAVYCRADLSVPSEVNALAKFALDNFGGVDFLVNNASYSVPIKHDDFSGATVEHWHEMYQINVVSPFTLTTELLSNVAERKLRSVVNISSHAGVYPKGASIPYAVAKSGLNHLTKLLAKTLGSAVRVNAVAPGFINTPLTQGWDEVKANWLSQSALGRVGEANELADFAVRLMSEPNMTGQVLVYDGGFNL